MAAFSVTEALVSWIAGLGVRACTHAPADAPERFVTVARVGGGVSSYVDAPSFAVQAWAATDEAAEALANEVRLHVLTSAPPEGIHSAGVDSGPYPFPDESTRMPRYQLVLDLSCQLETTE